MSENQDYTAFTFKRWINLGGYFHFKNVPNYYPQPLLMNNIKTKLTKDMQKHKALSLLEACFYLILGSSLHMKIRIMDGKITENLGFKSPLWKVQFFFLFIFKFFTQNWVSLNLTTLISCLIN